MYELNTDGIGNGEWVQWSGGIIANVEIFCLASERRGEAGAIMFFPDVVAVVVEGMVAERRI